MNPQNSSNFAFITDSVQNTNGAQSPENGKKSNDSEYWDDSLHNYMPKVYWLGILGIVVLAVACMMISNTMIGASGAVWNMVVFFSLLLAVVGGCLWVSTGVVCLFKMKTVTKWFRPELKSMGIINITGTIIVLGFPLLAGYGLIIGLIYCVVTLGWQFYLYCRRKKAMKQNVPIGVKSAGAVVVMILFGGSIAMGLSHVEAYEEAREKNESPAERVPGSDLQIVPLPERLPGL